MFTNSDLIQIWLDWSEQQSSKVALAGGAYGEVSKI